MTRRSDTCQRCGRRASVGYNVPHSQHRTKRLFRPNIQKVILDNQTRWLCTRCLKKLQFMQGKPASA